MKIVKLNRNFVVGGNKNIYINEKAKIYLKNNEQVVFLDQSSQYEIVKKNWGFYATPSINKRLKKNKFRTFLVINKKKNIYLMLVNKSKIKIFNNYLKNEKNEKLIELTNGYKSKLL